ncbi:MAG: hypothetical protein JO359_11885 [Candidatus Eremiobacteraeota bacterium]|nr:hypothetical protein [Candidatus Eremiobacteraeota bacterium]
MTVPLDPFVRRLARLVRVDRGAGSILIAGDRTSIVLRFDAVAERDGDGAIYVRLAPLVRALGGEIAFDGVRKVAAVTMPQALPVTTPTPFDPSDPTVTPRRIFTPEPTVTPRPTLSGIPQPRRTPVPAVPSHP